ncbi:MAG: ribosome recycling factor [Candidatus Marinimicrobia bacterium]|nr:ribosome recycling factor [Candidatus Neomarinimicrobiota bacterium]
MFSEVTSKCKNEMNDALSFLRHEFASLRIGRASTALLDGIKVDYYGSKTPLNQVATISVPEARLIVVQPWEKKILPLIEKAIMASDLSLTPNNDGQVIRIPIPAMTEERRKEMVKHIHKLSEEAKVSVRNHRRDANETIKKSEKEDHISKDNVADGLDEIQEITNDYIKKIDEVFKDKEKSILDD